MKLLGTLLLALSLVACSSTSQVMRSDAISFEELDAMSHKSNSSWCPKIDQHVSYVQEQLRKRGLENAVPEQLNDEDRKYNATGRMIIWGLRIGCNNPNRYAKS